VGREKPDFRKAFEPTSKFRDDFTVSHPPRELIQAW
jgi:hypothetical protein